MQNKTYVHVPINLHPPLSQLLQPGKELHNVDGIEL